MNHEATIATLNMQLDNCAKDLYEKDKRIAELDRQLAEASAPQAADTDKVRELVKALEELADVAQQCDSWQSFPEHALEKAQAAIAKAMANIAAQAPVQQEGASNG